MDREAVPCARRLRVVKTLPADRASTDLTHRPIGMCAGSARPLCRQRRGEPYLAARLPCTGGGDPEVGSDLPTPWMKAVPDTRNDLRLPYARLSGAVNGTPVPMRAGTCGDATGANESAARRVPDGAIGLEEDEGQSSGILIQPWRMA